ncbi:MAG: MBL fold metallo-hydrolase [Ignavibacterium sp.]|nr:MAG: MBL fold metallo-hydrolase [Ignavibacterium sp.]
MKIKAFTFNPFLENTYIIWDESSRECAIIDPGMSDHREDEDVKLFVDSNSLNVKYLINTHCHVDHVLGVSFVKKEYDPVYFIPEKDLPLFENAETQARMFEVPIDKLPRPDKYLSESEKINLGNESITNLFTPGHTPGEFSLYAEENNFCITGDVLFRESIGRTDLLGGNYDTLINSIKTKLFTLPEEVVIYPGHGEHSTIGHEKKHNPFLIETYR